MTTGDFELHDVSEEVAIEEGAECESCGGESENKDGICGSCLDAARKRDREAEYDDYAEYLDQVVTPP